MPNSILTPLQMTAGEGLLQNQGLAISGPFANAIAAYDTCSLIAPLRVAMTTAGNAYPTLFTIGTTTCPALGDSVPSPYTLVTTPTGWVDSFTAVANFYLGNGDLSKFIQAESICQGYADTVNPFINSAVNSQTYLAGTFSNTNNMITGDVTQVNLATQAWGQDLANLGNLINLAALDEMGTPIALIKQLSSQGAVLPQVAVAFDAEGVSLDVIANINSPTLSVTDQVQKLMYTAMTKITGTTLDQVMAILKVKTANINTMADLLNPYKLYPNSFQTLTITNKSGIVENIYLDNQGTVNTNIEKGLPKYVISALDRLLQIMPPDIALANKALATSMQQITGITNLRLPVFATTVLGIQTMYGLNLVNAQTSAVAPSTATFYKNTLAGGSSVNGTYVISDFLGTVAGIPGTALLTDTVTQFSTMNLATLTLIYQQMTSALDGTYGDTEAGPIVIPSGPAAGSYVGTEIPPVPPEIDPTYDPSAIDEAMNALIAAANAQIVILVAAYPTQTTQLNSDWTEMAQALTNEPINQAKAGLVWADLQANSQSSVLSFIEGFPEFGKDTAVGGQAQFFEDLADTSTLAGQCLVGTLRQGPTTSALGAAGLYTNNNIPADPNPPPPQADLGPTTYPSN